jgi:hypothetical protein
MALNTTRMSRAELEALIEDLTAENVDLRGQLDGDTLALLREKNERIEVLEQLTSHQIGTINKLQERNEALMEANAELELVVTAICNAPQEPAAVLRDLN